MSTDAPATTISYREALTQAMREELHRDPDVFLMGEDIGLFEGSFKVTRACCEFGPHDGSSTPRSPRPDSSASASARRCRDCGQSSS